MKKNNDHTQCPAQVALDLLSGKWSLPVLGTLVQQTDKPIRFGELHRAIPGISQRELTKHLREFELCGIVAREVFPQVPPKVEYKLTPLGTSLFEPMEALHNWAETYGADIHKNRQSGMAKAA